MNKKFLYLLPLFLNTFLCAMQPAPAVRDLVIPFPVTCTFADGQELVLTPEQASSLKSEFFYNAVCGPCQESITHTVDFSGSPVTRNELVCLICRYVIPLLATDPAFWAKLYSVGDYLIIPRNRIDELFDLAIERHEIQHDYYGDPCPWSSTGVATNEPEYY